MAGFGPLRSFALAWQVTQAVAGKEIVVYPNSGERWDSREGERRWVGERESSVPGLARSWQELGATIIGGCCRVLPDEIAAIRSQVVSR
jgi:homocysteine S-methyltransferase